MWTSVGLALMVAGGHWILDSHSPLAVPIWIAAAAAGLVKARLLLAKSARRIVERIKIRGDGRCLGGFLSWKSWVLVLLMIGLGRLLRASPLPLLARGGIYFAIGAALAAASRPIWQSWRRGPEPY